MLIFAQNHDHLGSQLPEILQSTLSKTLCLDFTRNHLLDYKEVPALWQQSVEQFGESPRQKNDAPSGGPAALKDDIILLLCSSEGFFLNLHTFGLAFLPRCPARSVSAPTSSMTSSSKNPTKCALSLISRAVIPIEELP